LHNIDNRKLKIENRKLKWPAKPQSWSAQEKGVHIQSAYAPFRRDSLRFFCCAPKGTSKMTASKLPTGSAFQIFFECTRFTLRFEHNSGFDSPWPMLRSVRTCASIVLEQALFKITCNARAVDRLFRLAHQNINVKEVFHLAGLPSRGSWSASRKVKTHSPPSVCYGVAAFAFSLRSKAKAGPARIRTWDQGIMSPLL